MVGKGVLQLKQDSDWKELSTHMEIPENVTAIEILPSLWEATGTMEIENIRIMAESTIVQARRRMPCCPLRSTSPGARSLSRRPATNAARSASTASGNLCRCWPRRSAAPGGLAYIHVPGSWRPHEGLPGLASRAARGRLGGDSATAGAPGAPGYVRQDQSAAGLGGAAPCCSQCNGSAPMRSSLSTARKCGAITWPAGEIDLTSVVTPGGEDTLWIEVMASRRGPASAR